MFGQPFHQHRLLPPAVVEAERPAQFFQAVSQKIDQNLVEPGLFRVRQRIDELVLNAAV
mgnify:CR=1 FL=1